MGIQQMFLGLGGVPLADPGQQVFTTTGSNTWTCPEGVYSISIVCVGAGGNGKPGDGGSFSAGGGGGLGYKNNYSVTPGTTYNLQVGATQPSTSESASTTASWFVNDSTVKGGGGGRGGASSYSSSHTRPS